jgi:hypothetical protein
MDASSKSKIPTRRRTLSYMYAPTAHGMAMGRTMASAWADQRSGARPLGRSVRRRVRSEGFEPSTAALVNAARLMLPVQAHETAPTEERGKAREADAQQRDRSAGHGSDFRARARSAATEPKLSA